MRAKRHYPSDGIVNVPGLLTTTEKYPANQESSSSTILVRLLLAVPLLVFSAIAAFFGTLLPAGLGGILIGYAAANASVAFAVLVAKRQRVLGLVVVVGVLLMFLNVAIVTSKLPTK
jgi:hypothetical protein